MYEWIVNNISYWQWFALSIILLIVELLTFSFVFLWLALGAAITATILLFSTIAFSTQLAIWSGVSTISLIIWFKIIVPARKNKPLAFDDKASLLNQIGLVIEANNDQKEGRLKFPAPILGNDEWLFICSTNESSGSKVRVIGTSEQILIVQQMSQLK